MPDTAFTEALGLRLERERRQRQISAMMQNGGLERALRDFLDLPDVALEDDTTMVDEAASTAVDRARYEADTMRLYITYENNRTYAYFPVPVAIWEEYLVSGSRGGFVNFFIKPLFAYEEV